MFQHQFMIGKSPTFWHNPLHSTISQSRAISPQRIGAFETRGWKGGVSFFADSQLSIQIPVYVRKHGRVGHGPDLGTGIGSLRAVDLARVLGKISPLPLDVGRRRLGLFRPDFPRSYPQLRHGLVLEREKLGVAYWRPSRIFRTRKWLQTLVFYIRLYEASGTRFEL